MDLTDYIGRADMANFTPPSFSALEIVSYPTMQPYIELNIIFATNSFVSYIIFLAPYIKRQIGCPT